MHDQLSHYMLPLPKRSGGWQSFQRGFTWGLGMMAGACAGIIISAVVVLLLLYLFGH